ncbi:lipid kinase, YegS/Rv2252/BmrU family [Aeromicrobium marinum DSM 15272]|uniref:Lipid kinase, YegS/Rv2252/BmrU family n=1 Tax=Aeromicrobium marinum DSM 15272 TaxID=585531 RepID=E2S8Y3_9ACTN|nr:diacylglycerol kinase family protein [Aeromicrobium marinum]EFQ84638.1 lipid kinase, YegS/Rv2252/BmrU family [Aeromicrobium marinum DSM 15272]
MSIDLRRAVPSRTGVLTAVLAAQAVVFVAIALTVALGDGFGEVDDDLGARAFDLASSSSVVRAAADLAAAVFGYPGLMVVVVVMAGIAWLSSERRIAGWLVAGVAVVVPGNHLLKEAFDRPRPEWDEPLTTIGGLAFPSGHAAGAGLLFTSLILLTIILTGRGLRRRLLITLWVVVGLFVAASRVLLGVHHVSDVVAGLAFGSFVALGLWLLIAIDESRVPSALATLTGTGQRRAAVVLNPAKVGDVDEFKARVRVAATLHGWPEPAWFETTVEDPGHGQARAALEAGADLIVAAGGDGTVRAVCEEAARTGVAIGIIPHGTGNLLARNLGIPLNARDALDVAFGGQDKAIDLARFTTDSGVQTSFLVMAGLGMDAMIMTGVDDNLKSRVGWLAYFVSGVKALRYPGMKVEISVDDGEVRKFRARTVVIGNVGFLQGGIPLLPAARIDDGMLDVVVLAPRRFLGWIPIVWRVVTRQKRTNDRLDRLTGSKVHIKAGSDTPMQLDGDPVGDGLEITAEVRPGVLLVRVPAVPISGN